LDSFPCLERIQVVLYRGLTSEGHDNAGLEIETTDLASFTPDSRLLTNFTSDFTVLLSVPF
jgi:hypothetical protein